MRLPTERAHGIQIMNTCSGLAKQGASVHLYYSRRRQPDKTLGATNPFDFYNLEKSFSITAVPFLDVLIIERLLGSFRKPFMILGGALFALTSGFLAARSKPEIYISRHWLTAEWLVRRGKPTVFEMHQAGTDDFSDRAVRSLARLASRKSLMFVIAISQQLKDELISAGAPPEKILVVPDAAVPINDADKLTPDAAKRKLGLKTDVLLAAYSGQMTEQKGAHVVVDAAIKTPGINYLMLGGPPESLQKMKERSGNIPNIQFHDSVRPKDVAIYQQAADILLLPQVDKQAQSPMKLYEYIEAKRPIIASDLPQIREVLNNETSGLLVSPSDPDSLAAAVRRLADDPNLRDNLANSASKRHQTWNWDARAKAILDRAADSLGGI